MLGCNIKGASGKWGDLFLLFYCIYVYEYSRITRATVNFDVQKTNSSWSRQLEKGFFLHSCRSTDRFDRDSWFHAAQVWQLFVRAQCSCVTIIHNCLFVDLIGMKPMTYYIYIYIIHILLAHMAALSLTERRIFVLLAQQIPQLGNSKGWRLSSPLWFPAGPLRLERIHLNYRLRRSQRMQHMSKRCRGHRGSKAIEYPWGAGTKKQVQGRFCREDIVIEFVLTFWLENISGQTRVDPGLTFSLCLQYPQLAQTLPNRFFEDHFHPKMCYDFHLFSGQVVPPTSWFITQSNYRGLWCKYYANQHNVF